MTEIVLPAGTVFVMVRDIPGLLARAIHPLKADVPAPAISNGPLSDDDLGNLNRQSSVNHVDRMVQLIHEDNHKASLQTAIKDGVVTALNSSRLPIPTSATGAQVDNAIVMIDAFRKYAMSFCVNVLVDEHQGAATTAPVVADSDAAPDPERRLSLLRKNGGNIKYIRCDWKITGIAALVASEKAAGRKRRSEKTIRADLIEAAQAEIDAKKPKPFDAMR
jgi:hypothetical protein